jgi:hypothetical protein
LVGRKIQKYHVSTRPLGGLDADVQFFHRMDSVAGAVWFNFVVSGAPTAWDFSQVLGNLGVDLGFGDFAMQSWDFYLHERKNKILSEILTSKYAKRERSNKWYNNSLSLTTFLSLLFIFLFIYL